MVVIYNVIALFYQLRQLIILMKSKSKQSSKNLDKEENCQLDDSPIELLRRTSGTKPFQLSKIRNQKRSSLQAVNAASRLDLPRNKSQNQQYALGEQPKDIFLDLMINKKTLFNTHQNKILQSQRKNILYGEELEKAEISQNHELKVNQIMQAQKDSIVEDKNQLAAFHNVKILQMNQTCSEKKRSKCQCCLHLNHYLTQAVIKRSQSQRFNSIKQQITEKCNQDLKQEQINALIQLKHVKEKVQKSPFSFTSLKWRTKSQQLQVDKWKQKYGRHDLDQHNKKLDSLSKILKGSKTQRIARSQQPLKLKNPSLLTAHQRLPSLTKLLANKEIISQGQIAMKIISQQQSLQPAPLFSSKHEGLQLMLDSYRHSGFRQLAEADPKIISSRSDKSSQENQKQTHLINQGISMQPDLSKTNLLQESGQDISCYSQANLHTSVKQIKVNTIEKEKIVKENHRVKNDKINKKKADKIRFPSIQGAAVRPAKQVEDKKSTKHQYQQKIDYSWKEKLSRKVYMAKIMQQIPERWQYGESRDNSRQVDSYIKIKEEEERFIREQQERNFKEHREKLELLLQEQLSNRQLQFKQNDIPSEHEKSQQQQI